MNDAQALRYRRSVMRCIKAAKKQGLAEEFILEALEDFHFPERDAELLSTTLVQMQADGHVFNVANPLKKNVLNWHLSDTGKALLEDAGF